MSKQRGNANKTSGAAASSPVTGLLPFATMTCEPSEQATLPASMSSAAASPVRTCLRSGVALASRVSAAVCGTSSRESFANYDPASSSWRTSQCSLPGASTKFSGALPRAGMMRSGSLCELPTLGRRTDASDSSSSRGGEWRTPTKHDGERPQRTHFAWGGYPLSAQVRLWPTAGRMDFLYATQEHHRRGQLPNAVAHHAEGADGVSQLNPTWVEMLQGFPAGWTSPPTDGPSAPTSRSPKANRRGR